MDYHYEYKPEFIVNKYNPLTLHQTVLGKAKHLEGGLKEEFVDLLAAIGVSCKLINYHLRQAGLSNLYGDDENAKENASGEKPKKIDVISNDILKQQLLALPTVVAL
jgi:fructose-1,6-bisphosphatase